MNCQGQIVIRPELSIVSDSTLCLELSGSMVKVSSWLVSIDSIVEVNLWLALTHSIVRVSLLIVSDYGHSGQQINADSHFAE